MDLKKAKAYNKRRWNNETINHNHLAALVEAFQEGNALVADGKLGPTTSAALMEEKEEPLDNPGPRIPVLPAKKTWAPWDGPLEEQPSNRASLTWMFGTPGVAGKEDRKWTRQNIVKAVIPGLPRHVWIHREVEPYLREAIRRVRIVEPGYPIYIAGVRNFRHMRDDPRRPLSMHSWGIAIDFNYKDNWPKSFKRGEAPEAWSEEYMKIWPKGVSRAFVDAMQSCGFAWGSDWDEDGSSADHTFLDPMHFEWVARDGDNKKV